MSVNFTVIDLQQKNSPEIWHETTIYIDPTTRWESRSEIYEYKKWLKPFFYSIISWLVITAVGISLIFIAKENHYIDSHPKALSLFVVGFGTVFIFFSVAGIILGMIHLVMEYIVDPSEKFIIYSNPITAILVVNNMKDANTLKKLHFKENWQDSSYKTYLPPVSILISCGFISEANGYQLKEIWKPYKKISGEKKEIEKCSADVIEHTKSLRVAHNKLEEKEKILQLEYEKLHLLIIEDLPEPVYNSGEL